MQNVSEKPRPNTKTLEKTIDPTHQLRESIKLDHEDVVYFVSAQDEREAIDLLDIQRGFDTMNFSD